MIFETIGQTGHEQVVYCHNRDAGLKAIIAIHNTVLGPALGGTRLWYYATEQDALNDVLRLSRGMTFKAAGSGLNRSARKRIRSPSSSASAATGEWQVPPSLRLKTRSVATHRHVDG